MNDQELLVLSKCSLFKSLKLGEIKKLLNTISCSTMKYGKNKVLKIRGESYENLLIVLKGSLEAEINDLSGKTVKIETLKSPSIVASGILFASDPSLPVTLTTGSSGESTLLVIPKESVITLFTSSPVILTNYLRDTGDKINFLAEKIRLFKFSNLKQKTAGYLLDVSARQKSDTITMPYTKEIIAEIFGVTRPSLSRVFSELASEKIISQKGRILTIMDRKALLSILRDSELR